MHWPLINLSILFVLPVIMASVFLTHRSSWQLPTVQHGEFISQPHAISLTKFNYVAGQTLQNKWTLVYVPSNNRDLNLSQENLLRKMHVALGKDKERVSIITMPSNDAPANVAENSVLILNPQGFYIMYYADLINHRGLLADMRRLLKYSHA